MCCSHREEPAGLGAEILTRICPFLQPHPLQCPAWSSLFSAALTHTAQVAVAMLPDPQLPERQGYSWVVRAPWGQRACYCSDDTCRIGFLQDFFCCLSSHLALMFRGNESLCFALTPFPQHPLAFHGDDVQCVPKHCPNWACFVSWKYKFIPWRVSTRTVVKAWSDLDGRRQPGFHQVQFWMCLARLSDTGCDGKCSACTLTFHACSIHGAAVRFGKQLFLMHFGNYASEMFYKFMGLFVIQMQIGLKYHYLSTKLKHISNKTKFNGALQNQTFS